MARIGTILALGILGLAVPTDLLLAGEAATAEVRTLEGIPAFGILVGTVPPALEQEGIAAEDLKKRLKEGLEEAGLFYLSPGEAYLAAGSPHLFLRIEAAPAPGREGVLFSVDLQALQDATLRRTRREAQVATWNTTVVGEGNAGDVRSAVSRALGRFLTAHEAANPDRKRR